MKPLKSFLFSFVVCCFFFADTLTGQEISHPPGIYVRLGLSYAPMLHVPRYSALIDPLFSLQPGNNAFFYEVEWQSRWRFGILFQYSFINPDNSPRRPFTEQLLREFPNDYGDVYIEGVPLPYQRDENPVQGLLGCSYIFNAGKWSIQPRVFFGGVTFHPLSSEVALKRQNSNQLSVLELKPLHVTQDGHVTRFTFGFGTTGQWNFWRRWSLFGLVQWTTFKPDIVYSYRLVNQIDESETIQTYDSGAAQRVHMIQLGTGLTFRITRRK